MNKPTKGSFLFSTPAHILYMSTSFIITCMLIPQVYLACKHKKLQTLVAAMTLQRLPGTEAMSSFEIPNTKEAKLMKGTKNRLLLVRLIFVIIPR